MRAKPWRVRNEIPGPSPWQRSRRGRRRLWRCSGTARGLPLTRPTSRKTLWAVCLSFRTSKKRQGSSKCLPGFGLTVYPPPLRSQCICGALEACPLVRSGLPSDLTALKRPSHVRQFRQIPEYVCQQQSPHAGSYQFALPCLQQVGGDSGDKHKQKGHCHELKSKSWIVRRTQAEKKE